MNSNCGTTLPVRWLRGYYDAERQKRRSSMPYDCPYAIDHGVSCHAWVRDDEKYCERHKGMMTPIDALEKEIDDVIRKAREK